MSSFVVLKERSAAAGMPSMKSNADADATSRKQKQQQRILRSVHFDSCVQGILVPSFEDMSLDDKRRIWHNRQEYAEISRNLRDEARSMRLSRTARSLDASGSLTCTEDQTWCSRGIEHLQSKKHLLKLDRSKQKVIQSIINEQFQQQLHDIYDANRIAKISLELSAEAKDRAIKRANDDALYVTKEHGMFSRPSAHFHRRAQKFLNDAKNALEHEL